ncbi:acyclic terpene utilization AtuA family protein [Microdochium nivale]|nr:acyclic terpene utilization AtuA family protein [Microdochium nivale]
MWRACPFFLFTLYSSTQLAPTTDLSHETTKMEAMQTDHAITIESPSTGRKRAREHSPSIGTTTTSNGVNGTSAKSGKSRNRPSSMPSATTPKRAVRIGGCSGGFADRQRAYHDLAKSGEVDVLIGDHMSECTIAIHGTSKVKNAETAARDPTAALLDMFDPSFMAGLAPALPWCQKNGVKVAVNAGASAPEQLARLVRDECDRQGLDLKVAWVEGDDVTEQVSALRKKGEKFKSLDTGRDLDDWGHEPICAQAYLGGMGIAAALRAGADVVICGRVADAAPAVGAAAWWHDWSATDFDALASALIAGHIIECSTYATGGYYSGFKDLFDGSENLGYPIAAVEASGDTVFTKEAGTGGEVSVGTLTSQLVYEIQGPLYYNSDVVAMLEDVRLEQVGKDEVRMTGVKGLPPPPTTKVGITGHGGYQAEFHYLFVGLDIEKKAEWTEKQIRHAMRNHMHKFSKLKFHLVGSCPADPQTQDSATVDLRIFVQTKDPSILGMGSWASLGGAESFTRWCMQNFLTSCPGASVVPDGRQSSGKPIWEYWPTLLPQSMIQQRACLEWLPADGGGSGYKTVDIPAPTQTRPFSKQQPSYDTADPVPLDSFGPTTRGPLGWVVMGRSGDKASDANVGFFVRDRGDGSGGNSEEWDWLRSLLSTQKFIELLGAEYLGHGVDRFEMRHLGAVHFLVRDHLDRGFNSTSSMDALGKNLCEFVRARHVDIPDRFLERGKI